MGCGASDAAADVKAANRPETVKKPDPSPQPTIQATQPPAPQQQPYQPQPQPPPVQQTQPPPPQQQQQPPPPKPPAQSFPVQQQPPPPAVPAQVPQQQATAHPPAAAGAAAAPAAASPGGAPSIEDVEKESNLLTKLVVDEKMALEQVSNDGDLLVELNTMLVEQYKKDFPDICKNIANSDWYPMWKAAHSLKGAAANLGVARVAACCQLLEHYGKDLENVGKGGGTVTQQQKDRVEVYRQVLEKHWADYLVKFEDFKTRMPKG